MKNTENLDLQNLSDKDLKETNGGSPLTYWLFYGIGNSMASIADIGAGGGHLTLFG